jgi:hypothetical protein
MNTPQTPAHQRYTAVGQSLASHGVKLSSMFGMDCLKINRKPLAVIDGDDMVFRLSDSDCETLLDSVADAQPWRTKDTNKPMKGWILIPFSQADTWDEWAERALNFTQSLA